MTVTDSRCPAAHRDDPTDCTGPVCVTVLDAENAGANGCEHHAARLLASLEGGRVYALPDAPDGAALRVFTAAADIRPFPWVTGTPRTRPDQFSHNEAARMRACPGVGEYGHGLTTRTVHWGCCPASR
jgi:hypothetical protein